MIAGTSNAVPRVELMNNINELVVNHHIYVHAPAGYGKTYTARLWLDQADLSHAWIALDVETANNFSYFCETFANALLSLQPSNEALCNIVTHNSFSSAPTEFIIRSLRTLAETENKQVVVLDDLHLIKNDEILNKLQDFIKLLPSSLAILVLSRAIPPESFSELILKKLFAMIGMKQLVFSQSEIKEFFRRRGQAISAKQTENVFSLTGGWAIGINALLISDKLSKNEESITGCDERLAEKYLDSFLKTQVWDKWNAKLKDFMINVSVVHEFTEALAVALTGARDSKRILEWLLNENAFLSLDQNGVYRFHHLFLQFLSGIMENGGNELRNRQNKKAAEWYYKQKNYYKAIIYFIKNGDHDGIARSLRHMYDYNSPYASIEDTLHTIRTSVDDDIVKKYPFLLEVLAWAAFTEGRYEALTDYLDQYYSRFSEIVIQNPKSAQTYFLIRCIDPRISMVAYTKKLKRLPLKDHLTQKAFLPSLTQNMPYFHRSSRDFLEYVFDVDDSLSALKKTVGVLFRKEYDILEDCLRAGLSYETGNINEAYRFAISANARFNENVSAEMKFCAMMLLTSVLLAKGEKTEARIILDAVQEMIETHRAFYLNANYEAYKCRMKLSDGDENTARAWLKDFGSSSHDRPSLYQVYIHFTTARANITLGDYNTAIILLKKLLELGESMARPLDVIEANILLAVAFWKKERGGKNEAMSYIECAIKAAYPYGLTQIFVNESADLYNMLSRTQCRVARKDYIGDMPGAFTKSLCLLVAGHSKHRQGLTGGEVRAGIKFTKQQKAVVELLCQGYSYREIAERMGLKYSGVKSHMELICRKLDVPSGADAVAKINELNLLEDV